MKYELCSDAAFINHCLTSPEVWRFGRDDGISQINPGHFQARTDGSVIYVKAGNYGIFIGIPLNHINIEVHIALLPGVKGRAVGLCRGAAQWIFLQSPKPLRLTASIPSSNLLAIRLARQIGMEFIGINRNSFLKDGVLYDQHLFGMSKEDVCHH